MAPARELPAMRSDLPPTPPDQGRVVLDVVDGPSTVSEVLTHSSASGSSVAVSSRGTLVVGSSSAQGETSRTVCTTPCAVDLPYGTHELRFVLDADPRRAEVANVMVGTRPRAFRRQLHYDSGPPPGSIAGMLLTGIGFGCAAVFLAGAVYEPFRDGFLATAGALTVLGVIGSVLLAVFPRELRPGVVSEWELAAQEPDAPAEHRTSPVRRGQPRRP
jgi:hypothetical protein